MCVKMKLNIIDWL